MALNCVVTAMQTPQPFWWQHWTRLEFMIHPSNGGTVNSALPPNNSFKPTPLRGAA